jgi:DNA repair exonuclease SbcCD nuclease subunit
MEISMGFQFIHAADLHLGSPFLGLAMHNEEIAKRFSSASREAFTDLVTQAIDLRVAFVVIAGDIYDGDWKDTSIGLFFNRELARLDRSGIPVFIAKGNHDAESVITKAISLPSSVAVFPSSKAKTFPIENIKVALHGRSFPHRAVTDNFALSYPPPTPGWFNIGVLHTSCGRPNHDNYSPCSVSNLTSRNYQYWALGHIHEYEEVCRDPWVVFPGNLQGRGIQECGPRGAVLVDVRDGEVKEVKRLILDKARWAIASVDIAEIETEADVLQQIEKDVRPLVDQAEGRLLALQLRLHGVSSLTRRLKARIDDLSDEVQAILHRFHDDAWLQKLRVDTVEPTMTIDSAISSIDFASVLDGIELDAVVRAAAANELAIMKGKLPGGVAGDSAAADDLDALLAEARDLVLGRVNS